MHAATLESRNPVRLCVKPFQESVKQPNTAETELVQRLKAGYETTFREIVERFGPNIYRVAYAILRNTEDADDIAQEVFAKVFFSIKTFEGRSSLYTWISRRSQRVLRIPAKETGQAGKRERCCRWRNFDAYADDARPAADRRSCPHAEGLC
jgi:DNA-directed RNA polymerase specialized sigma24 family protein